MTSTKEEQVCKNEHGVRERKKKKEHNGQSTLNVQVRGIGKQEGKADRKNCTKTKNLKQNVFIITQGDVWRVQ